MMAVRVSAVTHRCATLLEESRHSAIAKTAVAMVVAVSFDRFPMSRLRKFSSEIAAHAPSVRATLARIALSSAADLELSMNSIDTLIAKRQPAHSLAREFYTSSDIFHLDMTQIFGRHWIYVGVEPDVPEPGDVMTVEIGDTSILIVRDDDLNVRAFHNVCRHRGAQLVEPGNSNVGNLVCRYHAWTYNLDGALIFADHMEASFDKACRGLKHVHLRSLAGLLFICLAKDPPADFEEMAATMTPYIAPHGIADCKVAHSVDLIEEGNWKLAIENNRECYHCGANHPELTRSLFAYGFGFAPQALGDDEREDAERYAATVAECHAEWEASGLPAREIEHLADRVTGFRCERLPIDRYGESQTLDTRAACTIKLGTIQNARSGGLSFWTQPNSWHHFMADHIVTFMLIPLSPERTLVRTKWLVHKDAVEDVDYTVANLTAVWEATNRQDGMLVGITQAGVRSPAYEPGPYSPFTEGLVEKFCLWYLDRMRTGRPA
jgi:Rieske 2Fe-2S family protein